MPTVRTTCPSCESVIVSAADLTIRRRPEAGHTEAVFVCPDCHQLVELAVSDKMVPVLIGAGCLVEPWLAADEVAWVGDVGDVGEVGMASLLHPSLSGSITETEIACFIADLERHDWADELRA